MTPRWSNPSGGLSVDRFHVWPAGSDSYSHTDLSANFDKLDGMFGIPSGGDNWPPTEGIDGGVYALIQALTLDRAPLGSVWFWFRPNTSVPLTIYTNYGWVVADGSTLTASQHSFPGGGSITLPNLLNMFVVGADATKAIGQGGVPYTDAAISSPTGAPGPQGTLGANTVGLTSDQNGTHSHVVHDDGHTHPIGNAPGGTYGGGDYWIFNGAPVTFDKPITWARSDTGWANARLDNSGLGAAHENRPLAVGLVPIVKVKYATFP